MDKNVGVCSSVPRVSGMLFCPNSSPLILKRTCSFLRHNYVQALSAQSYTNLRCGVIACEMLHGTRIRLRGFAAERAEWNGKTAMVERVRDDGRMLVTAARHNGLFFVAAKEMTTGNIFWFTLTNNTSKLYLQHRCAEFNNSSTVKTFA